MQKKHFVLVAAILAALIALASLVTVIVEKNREPENQESEILQVDRAEKQTEDPYCLLVLGKDRAAGLTDVIMLVSFDIENGRICVLQIPRDTYADYGDPSHNKLNSALASLGGEGKLKGFIEKSFGISIDGYLSLDLNAFRDIVDAVGGVEIDLPEALYYSDPSQNLYIELPAGKLTLEKK